MFIKPSILIILAVLLLLIAIFIGACSRYRFHSKSPQEKAEWVVKKISSELDLDDSQKAKLDGIKSEFLAKHESMKGAKSEIWNEVHTQIKAEKIDAEKLNTLFTEKESQFKEMRAFAVSKFTEFHAILTAEQRATLVEKMEHKMHERWHH